MERATEEVIEERRAANRKADAEGEASGLVNLRTAALI